MPITPEEHQKILDLYEPCKGNMAEAVRRFKKDTGRAIVYQTVKKYWEKAGYEINPMGGRRVALNGGRGALTEEEIQHVIQAFYIYDGNAQRAAKEMPYSYNTFYKYWKEGGLIKRKKMTKPKKSNLENVIESHIPSK